MAFTFSPHSLLSFLRRLQYGGQWKYCRERNVLIRGDPGAACTRLAEVLLDRR